MLFANLLILVTS